MRPEWTPEEYRKLVRPRTAAPFPPSHHLSPRRLHHEHAGTAFAPTLAVPDNIPQAQSVNERLYTFIGGNSGPWKVISSSAVIGEPLPSAARMEVLKGFAADPPLDTSWVLRGTTSNERYVTRDEKKQLVAKQAPLGRPEARYAALIPIRKNAAWWAMTQDERRDVFEDRSRHIQTGLKYLPAVARRLHHCRDLAEQEPFDFLTFFDYPETEITAFEELVAALRATEEWKYVDREVDVRLVRE